MCTSTRDYYNDNATGYDNYRKESFQEKSSFLKLTEIDSMIEYFDVDELPAELDRIFNQYETTTEQQLIDIENLLSVTPTSLKNGRRRNQKVMQSSKKSPKISPNF